MIARKLIYLQHNHLLIQTGKHHLSPFKKTLMKNERTIGLLLIAGAIGVFIPYTILSITFEYPAYYDRIQA
jgi:hypothetical protein